MPILIKKQPLPQWVRVRYRYNENRRSIEEIIAREGLHTVCQSAHCPNLSECWAEGHATFMIMGDICTRGCRFCAVKTAKNPPPLNPEEPRALARAISNLNLSYVVITSVDRDDLEDGGAKHYARCIREVKKTGVIIEVLIPDFSAKEEALEEIAKAEPHVVAHNLETVERLTAKVRDRRASYSQSLHVLKRIKELNPKIITKTGIMVGLGEREEEVKQAMEDALKAGVEIFTIGQYLRPSPLHLPVEEFVTLEKFEKYKKEGERLGLVVSAGPLVRSSYKALESYKRCMGGGVGKD